MKLLSSLKSAEPGFYVVYEHPEYENGLPRPTLVYIGPFVNLRDAEEYEDGSCKREGIFLKKGDSHD